MSVLVAGGVAGAYVATVIGLHRWNVWRQRVQSGGFPALRRVAWDGLLGGLLPGAEATGPGAGTGKRLPDGGHCPDWLEAPGLRLEEDRRQLLRKVVLGTTEDLDEQDALEAGFSGGQARWVETLALFRRLPLRALERLEKSTLSSAAELYLREYLRLSEQTDALNLEVSVFSSRRRLAEGVRRFGDVPALYFARALASSMVGMNRSAIDDLARAVYFSRQARFYVLAVLDTPYIQLARPPLTFQCRQALDAGLPTGETEAQG